MNMTTKARQNESAETYLQFVWKVRHALAAASKVQFATAPEQQNRTINGKQETGAAS